MAGKLGFEHRFFWDSTDATCTLLIVSTHHDLLYSLRPTLTTYTNDIVINEY